jgi:hypothetical protein
LQCASEISQRRKPSVFWKMADCSALIDLEGLDICCKWRKP